MEVESSLRLRLDVRGSKGPIKADADGNVAIGGIKRRMADVTPKYDHSGDQVVVLTPVVLRDIRQILDECSQKMMSGVRSCTFISSDGVEEDGCAIAFR